MLAVFFKLVFIVCTIRASEVGNSAVRIKKIEQYHHSVVNYANQSDFIQFGYSFLRVSHIGLELLCS